MNPTPSTQPNLRALSQLTDVTRSMGVEYGLELLLWLTYEHWRGRNVPSGARDYLALSPDELANQLYNAARESGWMPKAFTESPSRGRRDAQTIRSAFVQLIRLVDDDFVEVGDSRTAHEAVFEGLLAQTERVGARKWEASVTPARVARLMVESCRRPLGRVLDPAAGFGSTLLAAHAVGASSLTAWDIDESALALLRARAELAGAESVDVTVVDTLRASEVASSLGGADSSWDTVLLGPPWGMRPRDQHSLGQMPVRIRGSLDVAWALIADSMRGSGQAVVHLPMGALTRSAEQDARRFLLPHVEAVIALPAGAGAGTGVRSALVVLGPDHRPDVLMLTAEDAAGSYRRELEWHEQVLSDVLRRLDHWRDGAPPREIEEPGRARVVTKEQLQAQASLHPTLYAGAPAAVEVPRPDPPGRLLTKINLESFKSFGHPTEVELAPITLIYGPNASGKSSLIQSLLLQKQSLEAGTLTLSGGYASLGSVSGLAHRHDESRPITVGFEFAVPVRWEIPGEAISPGLTRALKMTFAADAAGGPVVQELVFEAGGRAFPYVLDPDRSAGAWRLPVDAAVRLVELASDPKATWRADPGKKRLSERRVSDARRILGLAHGEAGVPFASSGLLPDRIELDLAPYSQGATIDAAELAATSLRRSFGLLDAARADLERALRELCYLGPIRSAPQRTYVRGAVSRQRILDPEGADAANVLFDSPSEAQEVSEWLGLLKVPYSVAVHALQSEHPGVGDLLHLELLDRRFEPPVAVSAADVGFGVSQLLPLVVQLLVARDQIVCIEQPEIHLHPRLQSEFAELLIESTSAEGRANQVVVETHSEHLMLRLQRKIRAGEIAPADVSVLYVDIDEARGTAEARRLRLDDRGRFLDRWPGGFFDERFAEIFDPDDLPTLPAAPDDDEDEGPGP